MKRINTLAGDVYMADEVDARIAELECGIKGCPLPKYHHDLPDTHPDHWCKPPASSN